jgi:hypothetical protein
VSDQVTKSRPSPPARGLPYLVACVAAKPFQWIRTLEATLSPPLGETLGQDSTLSRILMEIRCGSGPIRSGAYGSFYRARDLRSGRQVAVKQSLMGQHDLPDEHVSCTPVGDRMRGIRLSRTAMLWAMSPHHTPPNPFHPPTPSPQHPCHLSPSPVTTVSPGGMTP